MIVHTIGYGKLWTDCAFSYDQYFDGWGLWFFIGTISMINPMYYVLCISFKIILWHCYKDYYPGIMTKETICRRLKKSTPFLSEPLKMQYKMGLIHTNMDINIMINTSGSRYLAGHNSA